MYLRRDDRSGPSPSPMLAMSRLDPCPVGFLLRGGVAPAHVTPAAILDRVARSVPPDRRPRQCAHALIYGITRLVRAREHQIRTAPTVRARRKVPARTASSLTSTSPPSTGAGGDTYASSIVAAQDHRSGSPGRPRTTNTSTSLRPSCRTSSSTIVEIQLLLDTCTASSSPATRPFTAIARSSLCRSDVQEIRPRICAGTYPDDFRTWARSKARSTTTFASAAIVRESVETGQPQVEVAARSGRGSRCRPEQRRIPAGNTQHMAATAESLARTAGS